MRLLTAEQFYILWYFSEEDRWQREKEYSPDFERPFNVFAPLMKDSIEWLIKEKYIKMKKLSFETDFYSEILSFKVSKNRNSSLKKLLNNNKFTYSDFFEIENLLSKYKFFHNETRRNYRPEDFICDLSSIVLIPNVGKLKRDIETYSKGVVGKNTVILNGETIFLKEIGIKKFLKKAQREFCQRQIRHGYFKNEKECLKEKIKEIGEIDFDLNRSLFLPFVYYFASTGNIKIFNIEETNGGFYVRYEFISDEVVGSTKIIEINYTKVGQDNKFSFSINNSNETFNHTYKGSFGILYNLLTKKQALQGEIEQKKFEDQIRYLNEELKKITKTKESLVLYVKTKERAIFKNDEIKFVKIKT